VKYGSVCSGIEAASVAWHPLGWTPAWFAEIEAFPSAVLKHHYPNVPNLGDMTKYEEWPDAAIDVLVGGTPCQSFSVAGLRKGLDDPRGNLMLTFGALARRYRPQWLVWENVPGVLSSNGGRDFGTFLGMLGQLGYGFAYRVLDAQYFGVAQRRRRVFVVGCLGDWRRAAAVLFERHSLSGHPAPSRQARQVAATLTSPRTGGGGSYRLDAHDVDGGFIQAVDVCPTLRAGGNRTGGDRPPGTDVYVCVEPAIAFHPTQDPISSTEISHALNANANATAAVASAGMAVRRLTPEECEALQGFRRGYTAIPWRGKPASACPDGPRYKALGNSFAVPVVAWIGERIALLEQQLSACDIAAQYKPHEQR
jgi:DNA (cytosine-5)-methyltransferase 1